LTEEGVLAEAEVVVIRVVGRSGVRCAELTGERGLASLVYCGTFADTMAHRPVTLVEKSLIVAAGMVTGPISLEPSRQNKVLRSANEEETEGAVLVASKFSFGPLGV